MLDVLYFLTGHSASTQCLPFVIKLSESGVIKIRQLHVPVFIYLKGADLKTKELKVSLHYPPYLAIFGFLSCKNSTKNITILYCGCPLYWNLLFLLTVGSLTLLRSPTQPDIFPLDFRFCDTALLSSPHLWTLLLRELIPLEWLLHPRSVLAAANCLHATNLSFFFSCTSRMIKKVSDLVFGMLSGCWARPRAQVTTNKV